MKPHHSGLCACALVACLPFALASESANKPPIESVRIHPVFPDAFACQNHWEGQLKYTGDALGTDCFVTELVEDEKGRAFSRSFRRDGLRNEDWFSWEQPVLAPFSGKILKVNVNPKTNQPGELGAPPASFIVFQRADGVHVLLAHVKDISVAEGDAVDIGQQVARVGNNGYGRNPHIHIGAWNSDGAPLQIQMDLRAQGKLFETGE
ncbi:MAG: M23 family metallopeptidase [Pseudomonadota bacterium]